MTVRYTTVLNIIECANCHMDFGVTPDFQVCRERDHVNFYCPFGHVNYYPHESDIERANRQRNQAQGELEVERKAAEDARNRARAEKAAKTRIKNRIKNGVCPFCNRHFDALEAHMQTQHAERE